MKIIKGSYLKHIKWTFRTNLKPKKTLKFVEYIITLLNLKKTFIKFIDLKPGFDIFCGLKESHLALSYWGETGLCVMDIFSCKNFESRIVKDHIKRILGAERVLETVIMDWPLIEEVRQLGG